MDSNWNASLAIILKEEGGNDDDPRDPGGRTSRGIIQREWNVFRQTHSGRPADVWQASNDDVATIYHDQYWEPYCDKLPDGVDLVFFNTSVNSGRQQAVKELQRALGIQADGMMGMLTFNALDTVKDIPSLIRDMCERRRNFYRALRTFPTFGKGWLARTDRIERSALAMSAKTIPVIVANRHPAIDTLPSQPDVTVSAKAPVSQANAPVVSPEGSGAIAAGSGSIAGTLTQIQQQLSPFADTLKFVQYILLGVALIGIVYMVYGIISRNKTAQAVG